MPPQSLRYPCRFFHVLPCQRISPALGKEIAVGVIFRECMLCPIVMESKKCGVSEGLESVLPGVKRICNAAGFVVDTKTFVQLHRPS